MRCGAMDMDIMKMLSCVKGKGNSSQEQITSPVILK